MGMELVELALEVEERFGIQITDEQAQRVITVGELCELVVALRAQRDNPIDHDEAMAAIRNILIEDHGVSASDVAPNAELARDLRMD